MKEIIQAKPIKVFIVCVLFYLITPVLASDLTVDVDVASHIRTIPETIYGANLMAWDGTQSGNNQNFNNLMIASGRKYMRWPGGSWGDAYLWSDIEGPNGANTWIVSYDETLYLLSILDAPMQPIVNFPGYWYDEDHSHEMALAAAVAWVRDQSSRPDCALYWEIGNEVFGPWEAGWFDGMCGTYYGDLFADFYLAMKAENPGIKIGAVAQEYDTPDWWNPGLWTRDTLNAAYIKGVVPDFLIIHQYPGSNQGPEYNPTLLDFCVDEIENFTDSLNDIISDTIGSEYVGQIEYAMTEWRAGGKSSSDYPDDPYERWTLYVSALFQSQYLMEIAKNGWQVSNSWGQNEIGDDWYPYPDWFIYPFFTRKFGREMVEATSSASIVRAYASIDDGNNLTVFIANNSPDTDLTAQVNITGLAAGTSGQSWVIEPAGTVPPGGTVQDVGDLQINGIVHPNPLTLDTLSPLTFTSANSFEVALPKSCMMFLKVPNVAGQAPYGSSPQSIPGRIEAEDYDAGGESVAYHDTNSGNTGGAYRSDDVDIEWCSEGGYNVGWIEEGEWLEYTVDVESTGIYEIEVRVASASAGGDFHIEFDKTDVTGVLNFAPTGGAQNWISVYANHVFFKDGQRVMRLSMDSSGWNINWINFTKLGWGSGTILREWWDDISGTSVSNLTSNANYPDNPSGSEQLLSLEGPVDWSNIYGTRIRGYVHPISSGDYIFWLASDDNGELWLSTDSNPANATIISNVPDWTNSRQWDKYPEQQSSSISLIAGQKYYIEVLHKENWGGDNIAVAWEGPGLSQQVIDGMYLSPWRGNEWTYGDFTGDNFIDAHDLFEFCEIWLDEDCSFPGPDMDGDCIIDLYEYSLMARNWLKEIE